MPLTTAQLEYLATQRLGRLATVSSDGVVQVNPVGYHYNADLDTIDIGGRALATSKKFRNVEAGSQAAFVVDDIASLQPWEVRGVEVRGRAEALHDQDPPRQGMSRDLIRVHLDRVIAWGLPD